MAASSGARDVTQLYLDGLPPEEAETITEGSGERRHVRGGNQGVVRASYEPSATCCRVAKSSAIFTGSVVVISVVDVDRTSFSVLAAM